MKPRLAIVTWVDSATRRPPWSSDDEALSLRPTDVITVGWLMKRGRRRIVLAQSLSSSTQIGNVFTIPRGCVKSIQVIDTKKKGNGTVEGKCGPKGTSARS